MFTFFSPSLAAFGDEVTHGARKIDRFQTPDQIEAGELAELIDNPLCRIPEDAVQVTPEQRDEMLIEQGQDKIIRVVDGQVVAVEPDGPRPDEQLRIIRSQRNRLLKGTDHIVSVPDFAISDQRRAELVAWRAALRDMPEAVDPYAPFESVQWPERPEWLSESFQIAPDVVHP